MGKVYYYYCSTDTFVAMMGSHCLWLTNLTKSNDDEEVTRTFATLWDKVKVQLLNSDLDKELLQSQIEMLDPVMKCQMITDIPYGCCFCSENDLVWQWNEYGDHGHGVAVGFDLEWFGIPKQYPTTSSKLMNSIGYEQIIYDLQGRDKEFAVLFYNAIKEYGPHAWLKAILPTLKHYSGFIKNPTFRDERETRIAYYPDDHIKSEGHLEILSDLIEMPRPHYCLSWKNDDSHAIRSIMIGKQCTLSENEIKELLVNSGIHDEISFYHSDCSYRPRPQETT